MAKDITDQIKNKPYSRLKSIDVGQFEYTATTLFSYGTLFAAAITLGITYVYLLIQKIKN
jgi:hypothetical protein